LIFKYLDAIIHSARSHLKIKLQILKQHDANGDVLNIFKHMTRRADRLGLYDAKADFV